MQPDDIDLCEVSVAELRAAIAARTPRDAPAWLTAGLEDHEVAAVEDAITETANRVYLNGWTQALTLACKPSER